MYERSYGYKYEEGAKLTTPEIAKAIRAQIKQEVAAGMLPARWRYSVKSASFAGGSSIDVSVKDCADAWVECPGYRIGSRHETPDGGWTATGCGNVWCKVGGQYKDQPGAEAHAVLTEEALAARMTLDRIHGAYNHDGSGVQVDYFDVNYYGSVTFQDATSAEFEAKEKVRKAARRAALDAATETRKVTVYGRQGSTTHLAAEVDGNLRLVCGAQVWRSSCVMPADEGATVTCSRCAKKEA
jgi:hypothetical protein